MVFGKFCVYTAGPNTALIKSSSGKRGVRVVIGGRVLAVPIVQRVDSLSLELRTITVRTVRGITENGVPVDVTSCCQVKIQGWSLPQSSEQHEGVAVEGGNLEQDSDAIKLAAQHFIGKNDREIEDTIQKTIAGHQRAIIGRLTVEKLQNDRAAFSKSVLELCHDDLRTMGLTMVSYTVAEITDEKGYIDFLGVPEHEEKRRIAAEERAHHESQAQSRTAEEKTKAHLDVNKQNEKKITSNMHMEIAKADAQKEIDRRSAIQRKAGLITHAEQDAILLVEKQKALAAEAKAELHVLEQKVEKAKLTKVKEVHVEADAKLYKSRVDADGIRATTQATADRIRALGEAEADAIRAKGKAEIDVLRARVQVWKDCGNQAAILEKMIEVLPKVAASVAAPLAKTEKMVFVGSGGSGGGGPSQFTREMERIVAEVPETVNALTGYDIRKGLSALMNPVTKESMIQGTAEGIASTIANRTIENGGLSGK